MNTLTKKIFIFLFLNVAIGLIFLTVVNRVRSLDPYQYDVFKFVLEKDRSFDVIIAGTSHAGVLTGPNHFRTILELKVKSMGNLAVGGGGILVQKMLLSRFFENSNSTRAVIYLVDPWAFLSSKANESSIANKDFVFSWVMVLDMLRFGFNAKAIWPYFTYRFAFRPPGLCSSSGSAYLTRFPSQDVIDRRVKYMNSDVDMTAPRFERYLAEFLELADDLHQRNIGFVVVVPPTLIDQWPGMEMMIERLEAKSVQHNFLFLDASHSIRDLEYYYDADHLNSRGAALFTRNYLRPLLNKVSPNC